MHYPKIYQYFNENYPEAIESFSNSLEFADKQTNKSDIDSEDVLLSEFTIHFYRGLAYLFNENYPDAYNDFNSIKTSSPSTFTTSLFPFT